MISTFSLTSRVAGESKSEYQKRMFQRQGELGMLYSRAEWKPAAEGQMLVSPEGVNIAYVSLRMG
jgi:hypothetical protein